MNAIFKKKICIETVVDAIVFNAFISSGRKHLHTDLENVRTIKRVKNKSNTERLNYVLKKERKRDLAGLFFLFFFSLSTKGNSHQHHSGDKHYEIRMCYEV